MTSPGYLGIQFLNGYSHKAEDHLRELVLAVDQWIEENTTVPRVIFLSGDFSKRLSVQVGYEVKELDTVVGLVPVLVKEQAESVEVSL